MLDRCQRKFSRQISGWISGWTVPLLRIAIQTEESQEFLVTESNQIIAGTAPGRDMLCSSQLTALRNSSGGLRPIAVGELFWRLPAKAVLATLGTDDALLPHQYGAGSPGGQNRLSTSLAGGRGTVAGSARTWLVKQSHPGRSTRTTLRRTNPLLHTATLDTSRHLTFQTRSTRSDVST